LLAVDKPAGLPTTPAGGFLDHTLLARVRELDPTWSPLHRLGRGTSGVILFARGGEALSALSRDWRQGAVAKHYLAVASGHLRQDRFAVEARIGPVPHARLGLVHAASPLGRRALSEVLALEQSVDSTLCAVRIATGRPHQIRIHLAFAGHPLQGDPLYGPGGLPVAGIAALPGDGGYQLHSHRLSVRHPATGSDLHLEAPPPAGYAASFPAALASTGKISTIVPGCE
jgi:23S rRNA pseudouridine1911/1915/1917 synthase